MTFKVFGYGQVVVEREMWKEDGEVRREGKSLLVAAPRMC